MRTFTVVKRQAMTAEAALRAAKPCRASIPKIHESKRSGAADSTTSGG